MDRANISFVTSFSQTNRDNISLVTSFSQTNRDNISALHTLQVEDRVNISALTDFSQTNRDNISGLHTLQVEDRVNISALIDFTQTNRDNISGLIDSKVDRSGDNMTGDLSVYAGASEDNYIKLDVTPDEAILYFMTDTEGGIVPSYIKTDAGNMTILADSDIFLEPTGTDVYIAGSLHTSVDMFAQHTTLTGDLAVNGDDITSDGVLTIRPSTNLIINSSTNNDVRFDFISGATYTQIKMWDSINGWALFSKAADSEFNFQSDNQINMKSGDGNDYIYFYTTANIPYIGVFGGNDLYFRDSSADWKIVHAEEFVDEVPLELERQLYFEDKKPLDYRIKTFMGEIDLSEYPSSALSINYIENTTGIKLGETTVLQGLQIEELNNKIIELEKQLNILLEIRTTTTTTTTTTTSTSSTSSTTILQEVIK